MEEGKIFLGKVGEWIWYNFYFDRENDCFIEEKYHEEYLDTGTVFEGTKPVTAQHIYKAFIEDMNTDGITNLLKYADESELTQPSENQITEQEFLDALEKIDKDLRYKLTRIDSTYTLKNQHCSIIGVLSKTKHFYVYVDLYKGSKGFISKSEAFSYIIECLNEHYKPSNSNPSGSHSQPKKPHKKGKKIKNVFKKLFISRKRNCKCN